MPSKAPEAFAVTWTKPDIEQKWPERFEAMLSATTLKKSPYVAALVKQAIQHFEKTGQVPRTPAKK